MKKLNQFSNYLYKFFTNSQERNVDVKSWSYGFFLGITAGILLIIVFPNSTFLLILGFGGSIISRVIFLKISVKKEKIDNNNNEE